MANSVISAALQTVVAGEDLTEARAEEVASALFESATPAQIGALLAGLRMKGETDAEIAGFATGMRAAAEQIDPARRPLLDTCGTGGDAHDTVNISTMSAIVAAAAGPAVAKHGNYSVSSSSGSADVLDAVGVTIDAAPPAVEQTINEIGIGFMLAPVFHPAMRAVIGPRRDLQMRTIFNILGPLTNPAGADAQLVGVYDASLVATLAEAMARLPVARALIVNSPGLDEIGLHGPTTVAEVTGDTVEMYRLEPADFGLADAPIESIAGGTPTENAQTLESVIAGTEEGPARDVVLANTAAALYICDVVSSFEAGTLRAADAIATGAALEVLDAMRAGV
jgi:anthranilate phosphoribosyltransferase (EC 2.4.2.18)